jgi:hypothetical protein
MLPPPAMMPVPPPVGLAPPVGMAPPCVAPPMPCPPVAVMVPVMAAPVCDHSYFVDLKIVEKKADGDAKVVARPQLCMSERSLAHVGYGRPDLCKHDDGEEQPARATMPNDHIDLHVTPLEPGWVRLEVALVQKDCEEGEKGLTEWANGIHMVRRVKVGQKCKLECEDLMPEKEGTCWMEVTVNEAPPAPAAAYCPPMSMPMPAAGYCPAPVPAPMLAPPPPAAPPMMPRCVDRPACSPVMPAACTEPTPCCTTAAKKPCCWTVRAVTVNGKTHLEARCDCDACMTCKKMEMKLPYCCAVEVKVKRDYLVVSDGSFVATAQCVKSTGDGYVVLEGDVKLEAGEGCRVVEVKKGKVRVELTQDLTDCIHLGVFR